MQHRSLKIPLISKRMNSVEKYINKFNLPTENMSALSRSKDNSFTVKDQEDEKSISNDRLHHYRSVDITSLMGKEGLLPINNNFCVKYDSIISQKSQERL